MRKIMLLALTLVTFGTLSGCYVYDQPGPRYGYYYHHHHRYWR